MCHFFTMYSHAQMKFLLASRLLKYLKRSSLNLAVLRYLARLFPMPSSVPWYPHTGVSSFGVYRASSTAFMWGTLAETCAGLPWRGAWQGSPLPPWNGGTRNQESFAIRLACPPRPSAWTTPVVFPLPRQCAPRCCAWWLHLHVDKKPLSRAWALPRTLWRARSGGHSPAPGARV